MTQHDDAVELLKRDHKGVEVLLDRLDETPDGKMKDYFCELRETLVRHEVAEEIVIYPAFRQAEPSETSVADARIREQSEAEEQLAELEKDLSAAQLREKLRALRSAVLLHAENEEAEILPLLRRDFSEDQLADLGRRYERALAAAPTHPHPHSPDSPPGNLVTGPIHAFVDHVRDAMRGVA